MRILNAIASVNPESGGPTSALESVSDQLELMGHEVEVVSLDQADSPWLRSSRLKVTALGGVLSYRYSPAYRQWLKANVERFDCVVVHGLWQYVGLGGWRVLRKKDIPYFVFPHGMLDPWFRKHYPVKHIKKLAYWLVAERRVLQDARAVLFNSEEERKRARMSFPLYQCREAVVFHGTSRPEINREEACRTFYDRFPGWRGRDLLLYLGRLHEKKGCELLIEAFSKVAGMSPSSHLVMAGPGEKRYIEKLKTLARNFGVEQRVSWTGMLVGDEKWKLLSLAEVFVLPSHQENFGIAVAEALACSVPVLISTEVNIWSIVETSGAGFCAEDTLPGTVELLERWLSAAEGEKAGMRERALRCFLEHFEIGRTTREYVKVLEAGRS